MALRYEFLMHGILAVAALHLSTLQTARKTELLQAAMRLENVAIPSFRRLLSSNNSENIRAVFAFAGFVVPYMLAMSGSHDSSNCIPSLDNKHPHWFHSLRGLIMLLVRTQDDLAQGPLSPLLTKCAPTDYGRNPEDIHFVRIQKLLQSTTLSSGSDEKDLAACLGALDGLRRIAASICSQCNTALKVAPLYAWPGTVSQHFLELLHQRKPETLVILAHYCVLLKRVNSCWYFEGVGEKLLGAIDKELSEDWKHWIEWPLKQPIK
ncbi:hypothetical protein EG329_004280 [Mollisiaceae sp. DMI_Dod_QoI]|nr:hypothetical protein EG329_004280 [Helotiales sp. DMI_Dod_QoI]